MTRRWVAVAAALVVAILFLALHPIARGQFPLDDAWIHHVYARGLVHDLAPAYGPGRPEAGFSSPLWLIVLVPVQLLARDPVLPTKLLSLAFATTAAALIGRLATLLGASSLGGGVATLWALLGAQFAFAAVSGMEVTLTCALLAGALVAIGEGRERVAAVLLGLAAIARPETWIVVALVVAFTARSSFRRAVLTAAPAVLLVAAWVAYNLVVTGRPLPNTFYVKTATVRLAENFAWFADLVVTAGGLPLAAVEGTLVLLGAWSVGRDRRAFAALVGAVIVLPTLAILCTHQLGRNILFYAQRYVVPFTTLSAVFVGLAFDALATRIRARVPRLTTIAAVAAAMTALILLGVPLAIAASSHAAHCADIERLHAAPARRIDALVPEGTVVGVEGAGAAQYFSHRRIVDMLGLNFHRLAGTRDPFAAACIVLLEEPRLFIVPESWLPSLSAGYTISPLERYVSSKWSVDGGASTRIVAIVRVEPRPEARAACRAALRQ